MNRSHSSFARLGASLLVAGIMAAPGCAPDSGDAGGRIDPYETTRDDRRSDKINLPALMQFGDTVAERFAADLKDNDEIESRKTRAILELGTIVNKTRTPTQDFEQFQVRLRNALRKSAFIRDRFRVVESGGRADVEKARTQGPGPADPLQEGPGQTGTNRYEAKDTYVLQGDFYESKRNDRSTYYLNFQLTNVQSREIVFNEDYDLAQVRED
jgi:hypothetical protein